MASIFLGSEQMIVDQKCRVGIPARFMGVLRTICPNQNEIVGVMITPESTIRVMPAPYFYEEIERWSQLNELVDQERMILNVNASLAETVSLDKQNRIKLNPLMMELCGIERQAPVVFSGSLKSMQIYNAAAWRQMFEKALPRLGQATTEVARGHSAPAPVVNQFVINTPGVPSQPQPQPQPQSLGAEDWLKRTFHSEK